MIIVGYVRTAVFGFSALNIPPLSGAQPEDKETENYPKTLWGVQSGQTGGERLGESEQISSMEGVIGAGKPWRLADEESSRGIMPSER